MKLMAPNPEIFDIERRLWNDRISAILSLKNRNFGSLAKDPSEFAHERWLSFCKNNGLAFIPETLEQNES